jgi:hypothetical protein
MAGTSPMAVPSSSTSVGTTRLGLIARYAFRMLLALAEIDGDERDLHTLLCEENAQAP